MTNKPSKPINLFDCATSQKVIGQENFLNAFKTILNHGGYAQGPETRELDQKAGRCRFCFFLYFRCFRRSSGFARCNPDFR